MGQYFRLVNETKREVVDPYGIGGVAKFYEWLCNNQARVLVWLLRKSNEGGGGDVRFKGQKTLGSWAGDKVILIGDYDESDLYHDSMGYKDISGLLREEFNATMRNESLDDFLL